MARTNGCACAVGAGLLCVVLASRGGAAPPGPVEQRPAPGHKLPPPLPAAAPADYPREASLEVIREWLKAKKLEAAKARTGPGGDVIAVMPVASLLPEAEWLRLVDRTATDLRSDNVPTSVSAIKMAFELEQTSLQIQSLRAPLGEKVFPAAAGRLQNMQPEEAKQLPGVVARLVRYADPAIAIPVLVETSGSKDAAVRRQGVQGFMGLVLESEEPDRLTEDQRIEIAEALVARFEDPDQRIRTMAISLLGQTKPPAQVYVPKLIELLKDEDTCFGALLAIGYYGPSAGSATPAMVELLKTGDTRTRQQTCFALRGLGAAAGEAVPELIRMLETGERHVMTAAASALGAIGPGAKDALPKLDALGAEKTPISVEFRHAADAIRGNPVPK